MTAVTQTPFAPNRLPVLIAPDRTARAAARDGAVPANRRVTPVDAVKATAKRAERQQGTRARLPVAPARDEVARDETARDEMARDKTARHVTGTLMPAPEDIPHRSGSQVHPGPRAPFLAQLIAQEVLTEGLHLDLHPAATAAYRAAAIPYVVLGPALGPTASVNVAV